MNTEHSSGQPELLRALGLREGIAIHMGDIIGSGIFLVPATIAGYLPALGPIMLVWVVAGLLVLFGALTLAELSSVFPQAGGPYVYLTHGFGRIWGFLFSWNDFFINKAGSAAAIAVAFATFLGYFVPALNPANALFSFPLAFGLDIRIGWVQIVAMAAIVIVTFVNIRGVQFGGWVMNIFTSAKIIALFGLIVAAFFSGKGSTGNFLPWWPEEWTAKMTAGFGLAMVSALWAYDGWIDVTLTAGEFKDPRRNVPLSLLIGTFAVIFLYITANLAYAYVLPLHAMQGSPRVAADVAHVILGPVGASVVVFGILCSTFGSTNGMLLNGPRSMYAATRDGGILKNLARVHPRYHSPYVAIATLGIWGALLTLSGTYDHITSYVVFGSWFFYGLTSVSVITLRRKFPNAERPYKAWGYPYATLLFVLVVGGFLANTIIENTRDAVIGILLILISLPFYFYSPKTSPEQRDVPK